MTRTPNVFKCIETVENGVVVSVTQYYDDGSAETFAIGDNTDIGRIVSFERAKATPPHNYWYALSDTPSEWHKEQGIKHGWSWVFQLEKIIEDNHGWINAETTPPSGFDRYWCYIEDVDDLGISHYQWNCAYNQNDKRWSGMPSGRVTHYRNLMPPPNQNIIEK